MKSTTKVLVLALCLGAMSGAAWAQADRSFITHQIGDWSNSLTWEEFIPNFGWVYPATQIPNSSHGGIRIATGHTVNISGFNITADQLTVEGTLNVNGGRTLTIADGPGTDLLVDHPDAFVRIIGTLVLEVNATLQLKQGGFQIGTLINNGDVEIGGVFHFNQGTITGNDIRYGPTGSTVINFPDYVVDQNNHLWPNTNGPANVTVQGRVTLNGNRTVSGSLNVSGTLHVVGTLTNEGTAQVSGTLHVTGAFINTGTTQIAGTFQINEGATAGGNDFVYSGDFSKLVLNRSSSIDDGTVFWPGTNSPAKVILQDATTVTLNAARTVSDSLEVSGTLQVADTLTTNGTTQVFGTLQVAGSLVNNGTMQVYRSLQINGTLTNNGTIRIFSSGECQVAGTLTNNGTTQIYGTFQLDQGGAVSGSDFTYEIFGGTLIFNNSSASYNVDSGDAYWPVTGGPVNVYVLGAGGITMNDARTVTGFFQTAAGVTNASNLTLSSTVRINPGGFFDSSPIYSDNATLVYNTGGSYNVGAEWASGASVGSGVPMNVIINDGTTVNMPGSDRTCPGDLSIQYQSTLLLSATVGADLSVGGNWYNFGTLIPNLRTVIFNGATEQIFQGVTTFDYLTVNNPAGVSLQGGEGDADSVTVNQTLTFTAGNIRLASYIYGSFLILSGSVSGSSATRHVVTYGESRVVRTIAGGGSFQFPIGPTETSYNPLTIALDPADSTETFSVRVDTTIEPGALGDSLCVQRTWDMRGATRGDNHAALTFQWAGVEEGTNFVRNTSSMYLYNGGYAEVVRNSMASGTDPYIVSTMGGFSITEFSRYVVATSGGLGTAADVNWDPRFDTLGMNDVVSAMVVNGSDVYAGGNFTTAGGVSANSIAKWNGSSWSALGSGVSGSVDAIAVIGSDVYVGGFFDTAGGASANNIAKWNGSSWSALGSGVGGPVNAIAVDGSEVYVGGFFDTAGGGDVKRIAKWNGSSWSALSSGVSFGDFLGSVYAIAVSGSDVYVGGFFDTAGVESANSIAKWNGSSWSVLGSGVSGPGTPTVKAIAVDGNDIYVAGVFDTAGGVSANSVAKWNGSSWSALGSGVDNVVEAIAVSGGYVYVGGFFVTAGGVNATYIARWDASSWSALGSGISSYVDAIAVSGNEVYAGGFFTTAGNKPSYYFGLWHAGTTAVEENSSTKIPHEFTLSQNYPNPFNPSTTIRYAIPQAGFVTLKVYDLLGREIAKLVYDHKSPGAYAIQWRPVGLPSGVYFYRLQAGEFVATRKLILLQ